jgi:NhaA family Na+:H+ antiporter
VHATLAGVVTGLLIPLKGRDEKATSPLETLEHALHPWVAYVILPLFAFTNAGLSLSELSMSDVVAPVPLGIGLGLVLGKPIGIVATAMITSAIGLTKYPAGMDFKSMLGLGMLCGVGFTMSLFITNLAFTTVGNHLVEAAVLGVLCGSLLSAILGWLWLRVTLKPLPV